MTNKPLTISGIEKELKDKVFSTISLWRPIFYCRTSKKEKEEYSEEILELYRQKIEEMVKGKFTMDELDVIMLDYLSLDMVARTARRVSGKIEMMNPMFEVEKVRQRILRKLEQWGAKPERIKKYAKKSHR